MVLVEAFVFGLLVMQFAVLLFLPDERNLLLVWPDAGIADALVKLQWAVLAVASLGVALVTALRWRAASQPRRRALLPSLGGSLSAVLFAANLTTLIAGSPSVALITVLNAALLTVPAALLWGLLRSRLARGGLADLFRELGTLRGVRLEAGLAKVLGDPGLVLAYRVPGERSYMDGRGQPVVLPGPGGDLRGRAGRARRPRARDAHPRRVARRRSGARGRGGRRGRDRARRRAAACGVRGSARRAAGLARAHRRRRRRRTAAAGAQPPRRRTAAARLRGAAASDDPARRSGPTRRWRSGWSTSAGEELSKSLEELRELARGIHPSVLNHGLKAALGSLAVTRERADHGRLRAPGALA